MRRSLVALILLLFLTPTLASAESWKSFSSKSFGFSVRYPTGWSLMMVQQTKQLLLQHQGHPVYSVNVSVLPVKSAGSPTKTVERVTTYQRRMGNTDFASIHWTSTSVGGHAARAGILQPPTEGGVALSNGIYIVSSGSRVYEITLAAYRKPAARSLAQFPSVYRRILSTWHFL
jgi:hypothetical protein